MHICVCVCVCVIICNVSYDTQYTIHFFNKMIHVTIHTLTTMPIATRGLCFNADLVVRLHVHVLKLLRPMVDIDFDVVL